ncbi:MAG: hypothetical protein KTQ49_08090 [Candidatus Omnitrophica bacterium]|nr:hypothetical protein [Candidatus Omnitrophota bacterium]
MPFQMALDELFFDSHIQELRPTILRFYYASEPWISAGYSFRSARDLQKSSVVLENTGIPVCRRPTGGGCVLHGADLTFSIIARYAPDGDALNSVRTSYGKIHEGVKMGLGKLGFNADFYTSRDALPQGKDCFRSPVVSDLSWRGCKIAGGAQKRSRGVLLHQESIRVPPRVERAALARAVTAGLETVFGVSIGAADFDPRLFFQAQQKALLIDGYPWKNSATI